MAPKILLLDIEWRPTKAYVWQAWKNDIFPDQIIEHGGMLCVGFKWFDEKQVTVLSDWRDGHANMVKGIHSAMSEADAIVTYNGDKYDLRKLDGEFLLAGLAPIPPVTSIDVIKTVKKMGYFMNRLGFIGPFLGLGNKIENGGFELWKHVEAGEEKAYRKMERYCKRDVTLLEKLYKKVRPYIRNHPHLGKFKAACGACGSNHVQSRGYRRTKGFRIQRIQCQSCGSWQDGKREGIK